MPHSATDHGFQSPSFCSSCQSPDLNCGCDGAEPRCTNARGHEFVCTGTQYGGDDESYFGEGRCYCIWCGADGDA